MVNTEEMITWLVNRNKILTRLHTISLPQVSSSLLSSELLKKIVDKNGPNPASFSLIFGLFKQTLQFLQQIYVKKCPSSIWCWDSNPWPSECESIPITTTPGLPPFFKNCLHFWLRATLAERIIKDKHRGCSNKNCLSNNCYIIRVKVDVIPATSVYRCLEYFLISGNFQQ